MATKTQYSVLDFSHFFFNYKLIPLLARIFGSLCHSGLDPESILSCPSCKFVVVSLCLSVASVANYPFPLLARNFGAAQGVCLLFLMNNTHSPFLAWNFGSNAFFFYELLSIPLLARNFGAAQGVCLLYFMNNDLFPILARSFCRIQGLGRIQNGAVLSYCEYLNLGRKRSSRTKETAKIGVVLYIH